MTLFYQVPKAWVKCLPLERIYAVISMMAFIFAATPKRSHMKFFPAAPMGSVVAVQDDTITALLNSGQNFNSFIFIRIPINSQKFPTYFPYVPDQEQDQLPSVHSI